MHDNTLVRALLRDGMSALLVPTYTPIRTDDPDNVSDPRVFLGGIHVYLNQRFSWFRHLPSWLTGWLDSPRLLRWGTRGGISIQPTELGELTLSMLRGEQGVQAAEFAKLTNWLNLEIQPRVVHYTNLLIGGTISVLKKQLGVPVVVTLQGDDVFLNALPAPYQQKALEMVREVASHVDRFISFSNDYASLMTEYLHISRDKISVIPLGIDAESLATSVGVRSDHDHEPRRIGYLARLSPEKGLHVLIDAFLKLREQGDMQDVELHVAGWKSVDQWDYAEQQFNRIRDAGLQHAFRYHGSVDHDGKRDFLRTIDVLSVPATYREPKGIYVLEALASGVPVVQPRIGAFPEILAATDGGYLVAPNDPQDLAGRWAEILRLPDRGRSIGATGQRNVLAKYGLSCLSRAIQDVYDQIV